MESAQPLLQIMFQIIDFASKISEVPGMTPRIPLAARLKGAKFSRTHRQPLDLMLWSSDPNIYPKFTPIVSLQCNGWLTDNEPGDDQLSTSSETRGPSQADYCSVGAVPAGCRTEEPWSRSTWTSSSDSTGLDSRPWCLARSVRHFRGDRRRKADNDEWVF